MNQTRKSNILNSNQDVRTNNEGIKIENRTERETRKVHRDFFRELFNAIPMITSQYNNVKVVKRAAPSHKATCGCGSCKTQTRAVLTPAEIARINQAFNNAMTGAGMTGANVTVDQLANTWLQRMFGNGPFVDRLSIMGKGLWDMIKSAYNWAFGRLESSWARQGLAFQAANPFSFSALQVEGGAAFIQNLYQDGFALVRDKIMKDLLPGIKQSMTDMLNAGTDWKTIARNLKTQFGEGQLYQWNRLVRTEMAKALYESTMEQYKAAGVNYVQWSMAPGGCVQCQPYNGNIYRLGEERPQPEHPNCRCVYTEIWRLPAGAVVTE